MFRQLIKRFYAPIVVLTVLLASQSMLLHLPRRCRRIVRIAGQAETSDLVKCHILLLKRKLYDMTFRRTRQNNKWSELEYRSVGTSYEILPENINK